MSDEHVHFFEWLEIDWGLYAWVCACGEIEWPIWSYSAAELRAIRRGEKLPDEDWHAITDPDEEDAMRGEEREVLRPLFGGNVTRPLTIYVAGPMTGLPEFNYPAFRAATEQLRALGHKVLNPVDAEDYNPTPGTPQAWEWYMRHALRMVLQADALAVLPGWEASRGATLEVHVARALGMPVEPLDDWLRAAA